MYVTASTIGIIGFLLLVIQMIYLLKDYFLIAHKKQKKNYLFPNIIGLIGSFGLIVLSIVYFILVNNQL